MTQTLEDLIGNREMEMSQMIDNSEMEMEISQALGSDGLNQLDLNFFLSNDYSQIKKKRKKYMTKSEI